LQLHLSNVAGGVRGLRQLTGSFYILFSLRAQYSRALRVEEHSVQIPDVHDQHFEQRWSGTHEKRYPVTANPLRDGYLESHVKDSCLLKRISIAAARCVALRCVASACEALWSALKGAEIL